MWPSEREMGSHHGRGLPRSRSVAFFPVSTHSLLHISHLHISLLTPTMNALHLRTEVEGPTCQSPRLSPRFYHLVDGGGDVTMRWVDGACGRWDSSRGNDPWVRTEENDGIMERAFN